MKAFLWLSLAIALICGHAAHADIVGTPPIQGGSFATIDQSWLRGLAGGQNQLAIYRLTAFAGGGQASATPLRPGYALYQVDNVVTTGDSVALPPCLSPYQFTVSNNGANSLNVFASPRANTDTINKVAGSTPLAIAPATSTLFVCIENGGWFTVSGSGGGGGGGTGTVTSVSWGCGLSNSTPNPTTLTGTGNFAIQSSIVTTTPYVLQQTDACNLVVLAAGASVVTVPATSSAGFGPGNVFTLDNQSGGSITVNVTSPSNLDGSSSVSIVDQTAFSFQSGTTDANYHYTVKSAPGIGTVTAVTGGCGIVTTPTTIVNTGNVDARVPPIVLSGSNPSILSTYCGDLVRLSNVSNQVPTIVQAGQTGFGLGWYTTLCNIAGGTQTVTPVSGTIGGLGSFVLTAGSPSSPLCVGIVSDGVSDYNVVNGPAGTVTSVSAACGNTTGTGAITTAGTITGQVVTSTNNGAAVAINAPLCGTVLYLNNSGSPVPTIAEAGTTGFPVGWFTDLCNIGSAAQVLTPGGGTVGGASTKSIASGSAAVPTCIRIISDGVSNYTIR